MTAFYSSLLRRELNELNYGWAARHGLRHALTYGSAPCVIYAPDECGRHGNFHEAAYREICARPEWGRRLGKVLTAARSSHPAAERRPRELDSSHSSDALLMNIFCFPGVSALRNVQWLLGAEKEEMPCFGQRAGIPLADGKRDRTEIDMLFGETLIEAKLTESDFQTAPWRLLVRYRDLEQVFDPGRLPWSKGQFASYQLIRGVLAAFASGQRFCVLCDSRRPDLVEAWFAILQAVQVYELRTRLQLLTWQELTAYLPNELSAFLLAKYGISCT